jgi:hypothetical protein
MGRANHDVPARYVPGLKFERLADRKEQFDEINRVVTAQNYEDVIEITM